MSVIVDPKLGINVYAPFQSNQWEDSKKARRWLSFFASRVVMDTSCTALPASPAEGDTVLMSSSYPIHASEIARYSTELMAWEYMAPWAGLTVCDTSGNEWYFSGSAWVQNPTAGISALATTVSSHTAQIAALQAGGTGGGGGGGGLLLQDIIQMGTTGSTSSTVTDYAPTITQGMQVASITITPSKAGSRIVVRAKVRSALNAGYNGDHAALFKDGESACITYSKLEMLTASWHVEHALLYVMTTTSTNPITFALRAGSSKSGTLTVEADSWLEIQELSA